MPPTSIADLTPELLLNVFSGLTRVDLSCLLFTNRQLSSVVSKNVKKLLRKKADVVFSPLKPGIPDHFGVVRGERPDASDGFSITVTKEARKEGKKSKVRELRFYPLATAKEHQVLKEARAVDDELHFESKTSEFLSRLYIYTPSCILSAFKHLRRELIDHNVACLHISELAINEAFVEFFEQEIVKKSAVRFQRVEFLDPEIEVETLHRLIPLVSARHYYFSFSYRPRERIYFNSAFFQFPQITKAKSLNVSRFIRMSEGDLLRLRASDLVIENLKNLNSSEVKAFLQEWLDGKRELTNFRVSGDWFEEIEEEGEVSLVFERVNHFDEHMHALGATLLSPHLFLLQHADGQRRYVSTSHGLKLQMHSFN